MQYISLGSISGDYHSANSWADWVFGIGGSRLCWLVSLAGNHGLDVTLLAWQRYIIQRGPT